ncbi:hypothetical protein [Luteimonas saliphila]|uniref:hypothetical protein n=1 Tax=Luteimonas saliphila TaxID=2804919 RepID=UPI00192D8C9A|nr:hypothetical protein [Luteimonas saliphila]
MPFQRLRLPTLIALACTAAATPMSHATTGTTPVTDDAPAHARCAQLRPGMNYREAMAIMGRAPDSTLSGHSAAGSDGDPPAGSHAIDFWHDTDADGRRRTTSMRYRGGVIEAVDCGRPDPDPRAAGPGGE